MALVLSQLLAETLIELLGRLLLGNQLLSQVVEGVLLLAALLLPTITLGVQPGGLPAHVFQLESQILPLLCERFLTLPEFFLAARQRLGRVAGGFQLRGPRFDRTGLPLEFTGSVAAIRSAARGATSGYCAARHPAVPSVHSGRLPVAPSCVGGCGGVRTTRLPAAAAGRRPVPRFYPRLRAAVRGLEVRSGGSFDLVRSSPHGGGENAGPSHPEVRLTRSCDLASRVSPSAAFLVRTNRRFPTQFPQSACGRGHGFSHVTFPACHAAAARSPGQSGVPARGILSGGGDCREAWQWFVE